MRSNLLVTSIILALSVSLGVTGCSKGKKSKNRVVAPAPQTTQAPPVSNDVGQADSSQPGTVITIDDGGSQAPGGNNNSGNSTSGGSNTSGTTTATSDATLAKTDVSGSTGLVLADGSKYTTAADDELLLYLLSKEQNKTEKQKTIEAAVIKLIQNVRFSLDASENSVDLEIQIRDSKKREVSLRTKGLFNSKNAAGQKLAHLNIPVGKKLVSGIVECLDVDGGCETMLATFKTNNTRTDAEIKIVLRSTKASLDVELPLKPSKSSEYEQLETFIYNSEKFESSNRIHSIKVDSFEIVNGKSGVLTQITGFNKEFMSFGADLLNASNGLIDIKADRSLDVLKVGTSKRISNTMSDVRLIENNGLGQVKFKASVLGAQGEGANTVYLTFNRKIKPINHL